MNGEPAQHPSTDHSMDQALSTNLIATVVIAIPSVFADKDNVGSPAVQSIFRNAKYGLGTVKYCTGRTIMMGAAHRI